MIRHLARRHRVTVVSLVRARQEAAEAAGIREFCTDYEMVMVRDDVQALRMIARLPTRSPSSFGFFHSEKVARAVRRRLREARYDLILVHCSSVAHYVQDVRNIPKILDFGDMDSQKWLEYARYRTFPFNVGFWLEGRKLWREERRLAQCFDFCTATTRAEHQALTSLGTTTATSWFPNGVDSHYFKPSSEPYDADGICFVGRMDYYPNQEAMLSFCANVWPALRARRPRLKLTIVGADPSIAIRRLAGHPGVTVTGSVPDVRPYVCRSALTVAPLNIARGTQNKILESMALGVPVVASEVAAGGVDAVPGEHLLVASTPAEYTQAILSLLEDRARRDHLAVAGRSRMLSHHAWDASMRRLDEVIERCLAQRQRSSNSAMEAVRAG
jgi:hypothetical protein